MQQSLIARNFLAKFGRKNCIILTVTTVSVLMLWLLLRRHHQPIDEPPGSVGIMLEDSITQIDEDKPDESGLLKVNPVEMAAAVKEMTRFAWRSYADHCGQPLGGNELAPLSRSCSISSDGFVGPGQFLTAVDALDTLALMGLKDELEEASRMVTQGRQLQLYQASVSVFETCIRLLGGYLGAYTLTSNSKLLTEAVAVADSLAEAFSDPDALAHNVVLVTTNRSVSNSTTKVSAGEDQEIILAETGSMYLEFAYLSHITGDKKYENWVTRNQEMLMKTAHVRGLYPKKMSPRGEALPNSPYSAGGGSDSFYEYLLKKCLFSRKPDLDCVEDYTVALDSIMKYMTVKAGRSAQLCIVDVKYPCPKVREEENSCDMQHLTCFLGGAYALAYLSNPERTDWLQFAERITQTCYLSYLHSPTGLGPEEFVFDNNTNKFVAKEGFDFYILRPETIESMYYLHYITGDKKYQYWGRKILLALNQTARTANGFSGLKDMSKGEVKFDNTQQSFFLAETLKYLYLLFRPNGQLPLDKWLFNTEAHVFPTGTNPMRDRMHG